MPTPAPRNINLRPVRASRTAKAPAAPVEAVSVPVPDKTTVVTPPAPVTAKKKGYAGLPFEVRSATAKRAWVTRRARAAARLNPTRTPKTVLEDAKEFQKKTGRLPFGMRPSVNPAFTAALNVCKLNFRLMEKQIDPSEAATQMGQALGIGPITYDMPEYKELLQVFLIGKDFFLAVDGPVKEKAAFDNTPWAEVNKQLSSSGDRQTRLTAAAKKAWVTRRANAAARTARRSEAARNGSAARKAENKETVTPPTGKKTTRRTNQAVERRIAA